MRLLDFAPVEFREHLTALDNTIKFNKVRLRCELESDSNSLASSTLQHYVLTGNEGTGITEAINEISQRLKSIYNISDFAYNDATSMYEFSEGFVTSMADACKDNTLICITNAERLGQRGHNNNKTGIEELCNRIASLTNSVVVLCGKRNQLLELVKGHEKARGWFQNIFHFEDLSPDVLFQCMVEYVNSRNYLFDPSTEAPLKDFINHAYKLRGSNFKNNAFFRDVFDREIVPRISERVMKQDLPTEQMDLCTIMPDDLPPINHTDTDVSIQKLRSLIGLDDIKKQILDHTALVKLNTIRAAKGLHNRMPPMHMVFTGNPGTGKTTIAKYLGEIYHSIGVLSSGHVVVTDRSKLVGEFIGDAEKNTTNAINSASGGVLFIDEAYNLFVGGRGDKKDYGMRVIETLLTYLGSDDSDMIVILAGYTGEMNSMLEANPGMKSRFPYIFQFEDYTPEQLMQIGKKVLEEENYTLTKEAERKLAKYVIYEYDHKDEHFGNGRFITRLITTNIIPSLSQRLLEKPVDQISIEEMTTIEACDVPDVKFKEYELRDLDEAILTESIEKLNSLTGLGNAKKALNDYVAISRMSHQHKTLKITPQSLCWNFIGKTGTGKSTVAEILGKILQGLGILKRGQTICVNADELTGDDSYKVLERVVKEAKDGLLFLDMDAPNIKNVNSDHLRMWIFNKLRELHQTTALVFAQVKVSEDMIAQNLAVNGVAAYDNSIVFNDFTTNELTEILVSLLKTEYQLGITSEARTNVLQFIEKAKENETKESPVNARTIFHLAQTIAHITQLRLVSSDEERIVILQDVSHFKWDNRVKGKVGFV
jgi:SpoVK/Ycf46/Vps4 family AAA+-type ATPase